RVTKAAAAYGLGIGFGDTGSVGIGGVPPGGGHGELLRKDGPAIQRGLSPPAGTPPGPPLPCGAPTTPPPFPGGPGGGGNFGVATRFRYRLNPVEGATGGMLVLPATPEAIASFVDAAAEAPDELSTIASVMPAPPLPFVPAAHHGRLVLMAMLFHAGPSSEGPQALAPFRALAEPIADLLRPMSYEEIYPPEEGRFPALPSGRTVVVDGVARTPA